MFYFDFTAVFLFLLLKGSIFAISEVCKWFFIGVILGVYNFFLLLIVLINSMVTLFCVIILKKIFVSLEKGCIFASVFR